MILGSRPGGKALSGCEAHLRSRAPSQMKKPGEDRRAFLSEPPRWRLRRLASGGERLRQLDEGSFGAGAQRLECAAGDPGAGLGELRRALEEPFQRRLGEAAVEL